MNTQRRTVILLVICTTFSLTSILLAKPTSISAQTNVLAEKICPIQGSYGARFTNNITEKKVEDTFLSEVSLDNQTDFFLSGVKIAIVAYDVEGEPVFWTVLPEKYQLPSRYSISIPVYIDMTYIPAGEYRLQASAMQGNESELLGVAIRDAGNVFGVNISKTTTRKNDVPVSIKINNTETDGQVISLTETYPIEVEILTQNKSDKPLIKSKMVGVVTEGKIPLGSAVRTEVVDSVKLIPTAEKKTKLQITGTNYPELTVYAGLLTEGVMQPIKKSYLKLGEKTFEGSWPYLTRIGVSEPPFTDGVELLACVEYIGGDIGTTYSPLAVDFEIGVNGENFKAERITNIDSNSGNTFIYKLKQNLNNFGLTATLFQYRSSVASKPVAEYENLDAHIKDNFYEARETVIEFTCDNPDVCEQKDQTVREVVNTSPTNVPDKNNLWIYALLFITGSILVYVLFRQVYTQLASKKE